MTLPNFMVIGLQIANLRGGGGLNLPLLAMPDSEKPSLFGVNVGNIGRSDTNLRLIKLAR